MRRENETMRRWRGNNTGGSKAQGETSSGTPCTCSASRKKGPWDPASERTVVEMRTNSFESDSTSALCLESMPITTTSPTLFSTVCYHGRSHCVHASEKHRQGRKQRENPINNEQENKKEQHVRGKNQLPPNSALRSWAATGGATALGEDAGHSCLQAVERHRSAGS